ncbi:MAG: aminotransferase class V-fold PLP-dependent enzyme [Acidaminococcaceae bacterium]|nr:aminotransferase class V-fold PLP-dependent enzyme [Acidaminococcaceae bacterium]
MNIKERKQEINREAAVKQPLVEAMERYLQEQVYPLHTPGHKGGRGMAEPLRSLLGPAALRLDVSLMSELDDIHAPSGYIKMAQEEAAKLYGSDACFMAVNGTTCAIHAMLLTALQPGDKILIPRNAHRSVTGGLILTDAVPVYVQPPYIREFGLQGQVTPEQVKEAFAKHPDLKAVLLTSPDYFGMAAEVRQIADIVHAHHAVLLVDEAHGPHLGFHKELPPSAMQCGADMAAQSTHKILGALTQCSLLHAKGARIDLRHAADVMSLLTTTSPNYLLMGSLDATRAQLAERGPAMLEDALRAARVLRSELQKIPGLQVIGPEQVVGRYGIAAADITKVTVNLKEWDCSGIKAGELLRKEKIAVELTDPQNVLLLVTYADWAPVQWPDTVARICHTLRRLQPVKNPLEARSVSRIAEEAKKSAGKAEALQMEFPVTETAVSMRRVFYGRKRAVPLAEAAGQICAEPVSFYPPGIPVILPGERFTNAVVNWCTVMKKQGLPVSGPADVSLQTVRVLAEE